MAKKCTSCGFDKNPDNAHYCGKCGKQIGYETYKLYNASSYTPVHNHILKEYKACKQKVDTSWILNVNAKLRRWWDNDGSGIIIGIGAIIGIAALIVFAAISIFNGLKSCSTP